MLKTLLLVVVGLVAGLAIGFWVAPDAASTLPETESSNGSMPAPSPAANDGAAAARLAALENAFETEVDQRLALEQRVAELAAQLEALDQRPATGGPATLAGGPPDPAAIAERRERIRRSAGPGNEEAERRFAEQLIANGFAPDRAEWIIRRTEQLRMEALQAQYDARRDGRPVEMDASGQTLRAELGEDDYERYLRAYGRQTTIPVRDVLASSPAERSGLKPGDEIVAYAGKRVFDLRELNNLTFQGTPGESVVVEVRRDGQSVQLVLPRGPLGITGGAFRGR
jgi:hypothetical protein